MKKSILLMMMIGVIFLGTACGAGSGRIRSSLFRTRARLRRRLEEEGVFL